MNCECTLFIFVLMGQKKLQRFAEIRTFPNVLEYPVHMAGKWASFFKNNSPLVLELACGKGEYAVGLGRMHSNKNYIGVDLKGNRLWVGAKQALEEGLNNVAFIRTQIDKIAQYFSKNEVDEIWITFPDPQLRTSKASKRLTHPKFLRLYQQFLRPGGKIHLKTDSPDLYRFTKSVIELHRLMLTDESDNVYALPLIPEELKIRTHYEGLDIAGSKRIFYLQFLLPEIELADHDEALKKLILEQEATIR